MLGGRGLRRLFSATLSILPDSVTPNLESNLDMCEQAKCHVSVEALQGA